MEYAIDPNFRSVLRSLLAFEDPELAMVEKTMIFYNNLYEDPPEDVEAGMRKAIWFLNGGRDETEPSSSPRVFSWGKDSNLIFAAFQQTHRIDLQEIEYMHWWKFLALFMDLGSETVFCNLISLRKRVKTNQASKEERRTAREMGDFFTIEDIDDRTIEEKEREREFLAVIGKGKS